MKSPEGLYEAAGRRRGEQRFLILLGLIGLAMALILGAFFVGRVFSDETRATSAEEQAAERAEQIRAGTLAEAAVGGPAPTQKQTKEPKAEPSKEPKRPRGRLTGRPYRGPRAVVTPRVAQASCQSEDSVDAGGSRVSYSPMNMIDDRRVSAWRCDGNGKGVTMQFKLREPQRIVAVGLIPGYAKTDPVDGTDRYRQNRRIKHVRWSFGGGRFVEQRFRHHPDNRSLQKKRIPAVRTDAIRLKILDSTRASRNTVAISKAWFAAAR